VTLPPPRERETETTPSTVFADVPVGRRRFAVVGWPLDYSLSPAMHNAAISSLGLNAVYRALRVSPAEWDRFARTVDLDGFNVTIPYKENVMGMAIALEGSAAVCGAANTMVRAHGGWTAHNTDGPAFLDDLIENHMVWEGKSVVLLGAGGAARGALFALGHSGRLPASIALMNRSAERAQRLATDFRAAGFTSDVSVNLSFGETLARADLVINATSVGLKAGDPAGVPIEFLRPGLAVYDMVYHRETALVYAARAAGAVAVGGLGMLINQGALAFELWFKDDLKKVNYDSRRLRKIMGDAARAALTAARAG
jgi:shikimate dehydrogenase